MSLDEYSKSPENPNWPGYEGLDQPAVYRREMMVFI